jgi:hypothetical protein
MKKINTTLLSILILTFIIRLIIAWQPFQTLIPRIVMDDSFYGFSIARNIAMGNGITYNRVDSTNGFQPLWIFLITPIFMLSNINLAVNLVLTISTMLEVLTVFLIYKLASRYFNKKIGLLAAFLWAVNPLIMFHTLNGLELPLYIVMILSTLIFYDSINDKVNLKNILILGVLIGLTFLSRGDGVFLFVAIFVHMLFFNKKVKRSYPLVFLAITAIVVSPWLLYSYFTFGTITQSSFLANYYASHGLIPFYDFKPPEGLGDVFAKISESSIRASGTLVHLFGVVDLLELSLGTLLLIPFLLLTIYAFTKNWKKAKLLVLFSILLLLFYAGYFWVINIRYIAPVMPLLIIFEAVGLMLLFDFKKSVFFIVISYLVLVLGVNGLNQWTKGYLPWQGEIYKDAIWISQNTPQNAIVASFASGIIIYFSNRTVIAMDGVVDYNSIKYILEKNVYDYWKSRNVTYWVESTYNNQTYIDKFNEDEFNVITMNQWKGIFGLEDSELEQKFELIKNRCDIYQHMRGFDMLICFYTVKVN